MKNSQNTSLQAVLAFFKKLPWWVNAILILFIAGSILQAVDPSLTKPKPVASASPNPEPVVSTEPSPIASQRSPKCQTALGHFYPNTKIYPTDDCQTPIAIVLEINDNYRGFPGGKPTRAVKLKYLDTGKTGWHDRIGIGENTYVKIE